MAPCQLTHIPPHLHSNDKPLLPQFHVGEYVFRRCLPTEIVNPFPTISLKDISVNRQGSKAQPSLCHPEDTLYILEPMAIAKLYEGFVVVAMEIMEIDSDTATYRKAITEVNTEGQSSEVRITLLHDPLPCNYAHSIFQFAVDNEIVTPINYDKTLGKGNKTTKKLRTRCRQELANMIVQNQLWITPPNLC